MPALFKKTILKNGIRVLTESHQDSRCIVTGAWVTTGTRHENTSQVGISHLLEHMVFKGTDKYSALDIALALESKGGDINAFTAREHTCFHTTSLKEDMDLSVDVLSQLVACARFDEEEFAKEKRVVQQEILMATDDLEEYVYDLYYEKIFEGNPLGFQILGSLQSVADLSLDDVKSYYQKNFRPEQMIFTAAGAVNHQEFVESVESRLGSKTFPEKSASSPLSTPEKIRVQDFCERDCEQYHLIFGFPACSYQDADRFDAYVLNTALGGGMTSRLYQSLREDRGLVYSVFGLLNTFTDTGIQTIYAGTEENHVAEVIDLVVQELQKVRLEGLSKEQIELYKTQAKGQILIGAEDIDNRMNSIAVNEMVFGEYRSVDRVIDDIDQVNPESLMKYIETHLDPDNLSLFSLGRKPIATLK